MSGVVFHDGFQSLLGLFLLSLVQGWMTLDPPFYCGIVQATLCEHLLMDSKCNYRGSSSKYVDIKSKGSSGILGEKQYEYK